MLENDLLHTLLTATLQVGGLWMLVSMLAAAGWIAWRSPGRAERLASEDAARLRAGRA